MYMFDFSIISYLHGTPAQSSRTPSGLRTAVWETLLCNIFQLRSICPLCEASHKFVYWHTIQRCCTSLRMLLSNRKIASKQLSVKNENVTVSIPWCYAEPALSRCNRFGCIGPRAFGGPRLWWPRASGGPAPCVWIAIHFCQILLTIKFSRNGW